MITPLVEKPHPVGKGVQKVYRFDNSYGASVVRYNFMGAHSYGGDQGLWELAVAKFHGPGNNDWNVTYETPIADDVIGWLSDDDVEEKLAAIQALPSADGAA